ncbi:MAG TPA: SDR family oxidoreductase [Candidatus Avibacteroides excrementipullorum]|jgi:gluconate 5-dehydrogenase|nr:SDR family oxidoreductase [Candidatus Avibacteroides excrementipullorum]
MKNYFDFTGKVAVVTGASSGLGADAAKAYAECGASVALLARRKEKLAGVAEEIKALGGKVITVACDVTDEQMVKAAVDEVISSLGRIDILLNNAGVAVAGAVHQLSEADWDKVLDTNLKGMYLMCKHVVPHMMGQNYGKIVNLSSVNAIIGDKVPVLARHSYNASKAGVRGLTLGMAASYGVYGITVNCVGPGLFESEMTENTLFKNEQFMNAYNNGNPMGRPGRRGELNGTILYLSSDASSYVTGQYIVVDGGMSEV